ncbi:MAG: hypothetical protein HC882_04455 [Acidobacteria bacterium]|nr:hypothetical protein [Acidobacteriota bacterium]
MIDWRDGLPASYVWSIAQDRDGFIWIGTPGGVVRYDGRQARVVAPASHLIVGRQRLGTVFAYDSEKRVSTLSANGASPVAGPDGGPITVTRGATIADDGTLWITRDGEILRLSSGGTWLPPVRAFEFVRLLAPGHEGGVLAYGRGKIVAISAAGYAGIVRDVPGVAAVWARDDGVTIVGINEPGKAGRIAILEQDGWREIFHRRARLIGFIMRGDTLWASYDIGLAAIHPSEPPEWMPLGSRFGGGGPLMVDDEGSLWLGSFRGLAHFPEPDTFAWSEGGPETPRYVSRDDRSVWLTTWGALVRFTPTKAGWTAYRLPQPHFQAACPGFDGRAFSTENQGVFSIDANDERRFLDAPLANDNALCAVDASGRLWMPSSNGLLLIEKPDRARFVFESAVDALVLDAADRLWFSTGRQICHAPALELASGRASPACESPPIEGVAISLWAAPSGALWSLHPQGMARRDPDTGAWSPIGGVRELPTRWISALAPCQRVASGSAARAISCASSRGSIAPRAGKSSSGRARGRACPRSPRWACARSPSSART